MPLKNFYTASTVKPGDIYCVTIKVMVQYDGTYRVYRCPWPDAEIGEDGSPQGDSLLLPSSEMRKVVKALMPIVATMSRPDPTA